MSWHAIRSADGSKWSYFAADGFLSGMVDDVDAVAVAVRRRAVDDQAAVLRIRNARRRVRAARQVDERLHGRLPRVADIEHVQALLPGLDLRVAARPAARRHVGARRGVPRTREDLPVDDDVALARRMPAVRVVDDLSWLRGIVDADDPEARERPLVRRPALEGDVRVGQRQAPGGRAGRESEEPHVVRLRVRRRRVGCEERWRSLRLQPKPHRGHLPREHTEIGLERVRRCSYRNRERDRQNGGDEPPGPHLPLLVVRRLPSASLARNLHFASVS